MLSSIPWLSSIAGLFSANLTFFFTLPEFCDWLIADFADRADSIAALSSNYFLRASKRFCASSSTFSYKAFSKVYSAWARSKTASLALSCSSIALSFSCNSFSAASRLRWIYFWSAVLPISPFSRRWAWFKACLTASESPESWTSGYTNAGTDTCCTLGVWMVSLRWLSRISYF